MTARFGQDEPDDFVTKLISKIKKKLEATQLVFLGSIELLNALLQIENVQSMNQNTPNCLILSEF